MMTKFGEGVTAELAVRLMKRLDLQGEDPAHLKSRSSGAAPAPPAIEHPQGESGRQAALREQLQQAKKERDDALKQIRDIQDQACRENAKRNREINEFRVQSGHTKAKFDQLEACVQSLNRSNTDLMRRQISLEEAKAEIQNELLKSRSMVQRLETEVSMVKKPTEDLREDVSKMRSRLSEVIKTKLLLEHEAAAARQREDQLREELQRKMEETTKISMPTTCLQFDMTTEDAGAEKQMHSDESAGDADFDLEFTYEDATDLASYFPIARVASIGKRSSSKVHTEFAPGEFDTIIGELQEAVLEMQGDIKEQTAQNHKQEVSRKSRRRNKTDDNLDTILADLEKSILDLKSVEEKPLDVAVKSEMPTAIDNSELSGAVDIPKERPMPVVSGLALLSPYASFYKYASVRR